MVNIFGIEHFDLIPGYHTSWHDHDHAWQFITLTAGYAMGSVAGP